ncbi:unnamed protein product [Blepharisma stoltei]|uniref:Cullin N-terminal domain-containing protein n=1 Tax=Blepharisma stoltei TaxID=1481888 RepID=A0AAU9IJ14_9CILI|nr:unnamed protein product [Blepharisma stoltei]
MSTKFTETLRYIKEDLAPKIFEQIENGNPADLGCNIFAKACSLVYEAARWGHSLCLYDEYANLVRTYTEKISKPRLLHSEGRNLLVNLYKSWKKHKILVRWLKKIFYHVDFGEPKIYEFTPLVPMGLQIFKTELFDYSKRKIYKALFEQIHNEREGNDSNVSCVRKCLSCLQEIFVSNPSLTKRKNQKKLHAKGSPMINFLKKLLKTHICRKPSFIMLLSP